VHDILLLTTKLVVVSELLLVLVLAAGFVTFLERGSEFFDQRKFGAVSSFSGAPNT